MIELRNTTLIYEKLLIHILQFFDYLRHIWRVRYFWAHLTLSDLRSRWRRSFFGIFWSVLQPLGLTVILSLVLSRLFHSDIKTYAPYILSGIIVWEFIVSSIISGSLAFVQADSYIKQHKHPLAIYTLRVVIGNIIVLFLASICVYGWAILFLNKNMNWSWISTITIYPILLFIAWPLATILAYIGARFRDVPQLFTLIMQTVYFISPIGFEEKMFNSAGLQYLLDYNPIYHILQIIRAPLLHGEWPHVINFVYCFLMIILLTVLACLMGRRVEKKVIFYL